MRQKTNIAILSNMYIIQLYRLEKNDNSPTRKVIESGNQKPDIFGLFSRLFSASTISKRNHKVLYMQVVTPVYRNY